MDQKEFLSLTGRSGISDTRELCEQISSLGFDGRRSQNAKSISGQSVHSQSVSRPRLPPHLASSSKSSAFSETSSISGQSSGAPLIAAEARLGSGIARNLPPHLRRFENQPKSSTSSVSTATTVRNEEAEATQARQIPFNAWDARGVRHHGIKDPTVVSSSASASDVDTSGSVATPEFGRSKWPKANEVCHVE